MKCDELMCSDRGREGSRPVDTNSPLAGGLFKLSSPKTISRPPLSPPPVLSSDRRFNSYRGDSGESTQGRPSSSIVYIQNVAFFERNYGTIK